MKNVVMARIDDRLLHGQVAVAWLPFINADEVVVIDDDSAADEFMKELIMTSVPEGITAHVFTTSEASDYLNKFSVGERILILTKKITDIKELRNKKINIDTINLGGLGYIDGRRRYLNFIHLSEDEAKLIGELDESGCNFEIQMMPNDKKYSVKELLRG